MTTQKQRRAAWKARDAKTQMERYNQDHGICQAVGCDEEGEMPHHIIPKRMGGSYHEYTLDEKVTLCAYHHRVVLHDTGEVVRLKDGRLIDQDGVREGE